MKKSKEYFEQQIEKFDNDYWKYEEKVEKYKKDIKDLQYVLDSMTSAMENAGKERDFYQELLDDLINNEING